MSFIEAIKKLDSVQVVDTVESWEKAISLCFAPLLEKNIITENYIQQVISKGEELNFYFLLAPGLGMPHSRPEDGVLEIGISLLIIKKGVQFATHQHNPIYCLIGLAAINNDKHIDILMEISELFGDNENIIEQLIMTSQTSEVIELLIRRST